MDKRQSFRVSEKRNIKLDGVKRTGAYAAALRDGYFEEATAYGSFKSKENSQKKKMF